MTQQHSGVDDGAQVAQEPNLEVQLGFAGTLVATATAIIWTVLDMLAANGLDSVGGLLFVLCMLVVLQLYVLDHSWFLVQRGTWLGLVLLGRQDSRNQTDPGFLDGLEALYDAGSVRFYLGFANIIRGGQILSLIAGLSLLSGRSFFAPVLGGLLLFLATLGVCAPLLNRRWTWWATRVHPTLSRLPLRLGVPWVDMPYGNAHQRRIGPTIFRGIISFILLVSNIVWIFIAHLEPDRTLVKLTDEDPVVLQLHVGGVSLNAVEHTLQLRSDSIDDALLESHTYSFSDTVVVTIPIDALSPGHHVVEVETLTLGKDGMNIQVNALPAEFLVIP